MFRRGPLRRGFGRAFGRGMGRGQHGAPPPAGAAPPAARQALQQANQLRSAGRYLEAAGIFEQLALLAGANNLPRRAALLTLQEGECRALGGQCAAGSQRLRQGLDLLAANGNWQALAQAGPRAAASLEQAGCLTEAAGLRAWLERMLPGASPAEAAPPASPARLPAKCPFCGASLRSNEVEWLDALSAECPYCGSSVAAEAPARG